MYLRQALGFIDVEAARQKLSIPKDDGTCPDKDWWLDRTAGDIKRGAPGTCRPPGEKITITDHTKTGETGEVTIYTKSETGTSLVGTDKSPVWSDCEKRGLPAAECYKLRMQGNQADAVERMMIEKAQTDAGAAAALAAAQRKKNMRTYFIVGGIAAVGIVALSFFRK